MPNKRFIAKNGLDNNNKTITNVAAPENSSDVVIKSVTDSILSVAQSAYDKANSAADSTTVTSNVAYLQGIENTQNTRITTVEANTVYLFGALNQTNTNIGLANTQLKAYTDGLVSSANTQLKAYADGIVSSANTQLKAYTDEAIASANTQLKSYTDGAINSSVSSSNTQLKSYTDGLVSYISDVDNSQNTRLTTVEANTIYLFGALDQTNTNITNANTQLKSYTDGLVSSSVSSANTQLKSYTDGAISSSISSANTQLKAYTDGLVSTSVSAANTQLKSYTDSAISSSVSSANTQLRAYTDGAIGSANTQLNSYVDGQVSYIGTVNNTQNTNITTATNLAQGAYDTANLKFNTSGGNITGDVIVSANVTITGNLTVAGNVTTVSANNLIITDNMIYLNDGNQVTNPDLGFAGNYNDGTYHHAGFFRDHSDGFWKVFDNYKPEPDASPYIDTSNATFRIADFQANNVTFGKITTSSSQLVTNLNADYLNGQHGSYYAVASEQNGINATQNTNITNTQTWLDANIAYISGVNIAQNSSIVNANTQLKAYTDGIVTSANTQLKAYTDGAISSSVTSANTQLKAYTDGQISYGSGVNTSQNTSISALQTLANTDYTTVAATAGTYGGTTNIPVVTISANGRVSSISNTSITAGATITDDTTSNATRYVMLGSSTSGTYTVANTSSTKLTFNPSTGLLTTTSFSGDGTNLTGLNASNLTSGTVSTARLATGTANANTFLCGDGTWKVVVSGTNNPPIITNSNTIITSYTFAPGINGLSVGPMNMANGVSVTIPPAQRWIII